MFKLSKNVHLHWTPANWTLQQFYHSFQVLACQRTFYPCWKDWSFCTMYATVYSIYYTLFRLKVWSGGHDEQRDPKLDGIPIAWSLGYFSLHQIITWGYSSWISKEVSGCSLKASSRRSLSSFDGKALMNHCEKALSVDKVGSHSPLKRPCVQELFHMRIYLC
jgi:hypothetical protein